ncbi:MAG: dihydroorotase [Planctomycetota bacterium]|nr:dihydroorotase [Planctomycetota bacterium]
MSAGTEPLPWTERELLLLRGGTVVTARGRELADVLVRGGTIERVGPGLEAPGAHVEDVAGLLLTPGFVDLHVHLRDPGDPESETLESGLCAAAAGGIHHVFCMANTDPVNDAPEITGALCERARAFSPIQLHPVAAVTRGLCGDALSPFRDLRAAGAGGLSNDGLPVESPRVLGDALEQAHALGLPLMVHAEDRGLAAGGSVDARVAERLGARGIPVEAEDVGTARDVAVALERGAPLHVCHVSTQGSVEIVRGARREGASVTAEATPHHLWLTYDDIPEGDADFKMNPPLRAASDVDAVIAGILDGTVTCIATDHAPHAPARKARALDEAPLGAIGLETSFAVAHTALVATGRLPLERLIHLCVDGPAAVAGIDAPALAPGAPAQINVVDTREEWTVDPGRLRSRSRNCPFKGRSVGARVVGMVCGTRWLRVPEAGATAS